MSKAIVDITMSLDGFMAGPDITSKQPMGRGGVRLHEWIFKGKTDVDAKLLEDLVQTTGAVIVGSRTYNTAIKDAWEGVSPFSVPAFVLCSKVPDFQVTGFEFVTQGLFSAFEKANAIAGDKNIWIMGGAAVIQQYLNAGLVDEIHIHIAPVLFSSGTRLFDFVSAAQVELNKMKTIDTPACTHIHYEVVK